MQQYMLHCSMSFLLRHVPAKAGGRTKMLSSLIRFFQTWKDYESAVRELSGLNDRELADIGISRSDIDWVARQHARD